MKNCLFNYSSLVCTGFDDKGYGQTGLFSTILRELRLGEYEWSFLLHEW